MVICESRVASIIFFISSLFSLFPFSLFSSLPLLINDIVDIEVDNDEDRDDLLFLLLLALSSFVDNSKYNLLFYYIFALILFANLLLLSFLFPVSLTELSQTPGYLLP